MRTAEEKRRAARDARELATTPVVNPYRGTLSDPFLGQSVVGGGPGGTGSAAWLGDARAPGPVGHGHRVPQPLVPADIYGQPILTGRKAPGLAIAGGVISLVLGIVVGILGLLTIALVNLIHNLDIGDRSFEAGNDASWVLLSVLDFVVCAALIVGAVALMLGKLAGRIAVTVASWTVIGFSVYWLRQTNVPPAFPIVIGIAAAAVLILCYQRSVTRWLGVIPPPQPE